MCLLWQYIEHYETQVARSTSTGYRVSGSKFYARFSAAACDCILSQYVRALDDHDRLTAVAGYILAHKLERLTNRDIQRGIRSMRDCDRRDIESVFNQLDTFGWVDRVPGRKFTDSPTWIVNPAVHEKFKDYAEWEVDQRQQSQLLMAETIAEHEMGPTEIARHPSGYVLSAYPGRLTPPCLQLKLMRPGTVKKRLSESGRIWLTWNTEKQRLDDASNSKLAELPDEIQDWLADAINGEAARSI